MHMEADVLDDICNVEVGERQVLEGLREAPKLTRVSNRRPGSNRNFGLCFTSIKTGL
jgi:hypothetical protein